MTCDVIKEMSREDVTLILYYTLDINASSVRKSKYRTNFIKDFQNAENVNAKVCCECDNRNLLSKKNSILI